MRSYAANGYTLYVWHDESCHMWVGAGLLLVHDGTWRVNELPIRTGAAEMYMRNTLRGDGTAAFVEYDLASDADRAMRVADVVRHVKPWGWELEVESEAKQVQLKLLRVHQDHRTSLQYHQMKDEVMIFIDDETLATPLHVPPMIAHRVAGPRLYFEASTYHPDDVVRLADDYGR